MKIKDIVCSLELAKKLKELSVVQKSIYGWVPVNGTMAISHLLDPIGDCPEICSAFTSDELLEILPVTIKESNESLVINKLSINKSYIYFTEYKYGLYYTEDKKLSDSLAKILINLLENKIITLE